MNRLLILSLLIISFSTSVMSQDKDNSSLWLEVNKLIKDGKVASAGKMLDDIYNIAAQSKDYDQMIKALIIQSQTSQQLEEDHLVKDINRYEKRFIETNDPVLKALLANIIAKRYSAYLQMNMYQLRGRTELDVKEEKDILTYSISDLIQKSNFYYLRSIKDKEALKKINSSDLKAILVEPNSKLTVESDLYLLLSFDMIKHFGVSSNLITEAKNKFILNQVGLFGNVDEFVNIDFGETIVLEKEEINEDAYSRQVISLYQNLLQEYRNESGLIHEKINLQRLRFVRQHASFSNIEQLYFKSLELFTKAQKSKAAKDLIRDDLLKAYMSQVRNNYSIDKYTEEQKDILAKTLKLINVQKESKTNLFKENAKDAFAVIEKKQLNFKHEKVSPINREALCYVSYQNISKLNYRIVSADYKEIQELQRLIYEEKFNKLDKYQSIVSWTDDLPNGNDHMNHSIETVIPPLNSGSYLLLSFDGLSPSQSKIVVGSPLLVSDLAYNFASANGHHQLVVVDRTTGQAIQDVQVDVYQRKYDQRSRQDNYDHIFKGISNKDGISELDISTDLRRQNINIKLTNGTDIFFEPEVYNYVSREQKSTANKSMLLFTDRSIYRPGQTIHFKGIALDITEESMPSPSINEMINIKLNDANGQIVETLDLKSDEYGSISGTFILPSSGLNGNFSISTENPWSYKNIKVEDYKRPKFQPEFEKSMEEFKLGDSISLNATAKSYAGINLNGAKYKYTIYRNSYYPWYRTFYWCGYNPLPRSANAFIKEGEGIVSDQGVIKLNFLAETDPALVGQSVPANYRFTIQLDVTDIDGETRSTSKEIYLGAKEYLLDLKHPSHLPKGESGKFEISATNFDGEKMTKTGLIVISEIENSNKTFREKLWPYPEFQVLDKESYQRIFPLDLYKMEDHTFQQKYSKVVAQVPFDTEMAGKVAFPELNEGIYLIQIEIDGELQEQSSYLQVFEEVMKGGADLKIIGGESEYLVGAKAEFKFYSSYEDSKLFYRIYKKNDILKSDWTVNGKSISEMIDKDSYGNMHISTFYVKNNRHYTDQQIISVPWKNKDLEIEYTSFRDNILPGAEEVFSIKIKGAAKLKNQLTLSMYDASLDAFSENTWNSFNYPIYNNYSQSSYFSFGVMSGRLMSKYDNLYFDQSQNVFFPSLLEIDNQYGVMMGRSTGITYARGSKMNKSQAKESMEMEAAPMADQANNLDGGMANDTANDKEEGLDSNNKPASESESLAPPIRKNLNETVFFFPKMETNEEGELTYSFKMNEAITEWKLMSFAHNKEMQFGYDERKLVTKKDLLIQANMPRFLRAGDETIFTAKVSNLSETVLSGDARIEIINAITEESVLEQLTDEGTKMFELKVGDSDIVEWKLNIPNNFIMPVIIKVYAISGNHSDGEQNMFSVLTNRKLVTSTKSMMVRPNTTKEFEFKHLLENLGKQSIESQQYQIEFTTNPVWFAIKAMPYLNSRENDCTTSYADQLFGNSLASTIIENNPNIQLIFKQWADDPEALKSELEKNQELKELLLADTPWVRQSQSEEQQRRDIALLFEVNKLASEFDATVRVLVKRQSINGGFTWMPGGRDNQYVTQYVLEQLLKMRRMSNVQNQEIDRMISKGMEYLDKRIAEDYGKTNLLKSNNSSISYLIVHYSYLSSMYSGKLFGDIGSAAKIFYKNSFKLHWKDLSPYGQAMIAISHLRSDQDKLSTLISESLQERAIRNPELGAYWKNNNGYSWYSLGIEQQALLIEFFEEASVSAELVDEMKMWLLTKKQTTHWPTSKSTTAAIHALVNNNEKALKTSSAIKLWLGNEQQSINDQEAGSGYFEIKHTGATITKSFGKIKVDNPNDNIVWGAAYWQYWNDLDKVESADENPFTIIKEVYLQEVQEGKAKLKSLSTNDILMQGDKVIVRIELRTDRDLSYVHMRDMRAAGLEPLNTLSRYQYQDGLSYYESTRDKFTEFFFETMRRGTYVFEYELRVSHRGTYSNGITTAQCLYAPSFAGHSEGIKLAFK